MLIVPAVLFGVGLVFSDRDALVVYCAHDAVYSGKVLRDFEKRTGIRVAVRFDTEATKSLGLVELLMREKGRPRCDVFWNNELLGTLALQEAGILQPYQGAGFARIPAAFKDPGGAWAGFAARLRVYIIHTGRLPVTEEAVAQALAGDLTRVAIAKPLYGTTFTQYALLWDALGPEKLKAWHADWRARGVREAGGNAQTKQLVADGVCDLGLTDSDDFFGARDEGRPVAMLPVRVGNRRTVCIPNTVSLIAGSRHPQEAKRLVDFLLSAETELALAQSDARQIPLGPVDESRLPDEVRSLKRWAADGCALSSLAPAARDCRAWLKALYLAK